MLGWRFFGMLHCVSLRVFQGFTEFFVYYRCQGTAQERSEETTAGLQGGNAGQCAFTYFDICSFHTEVLFCRFSSYCTRITGFRGILTFKLQGIKVGP